MFDSDVCKKKDGSLLKTYESEYEAQEAIEYVKRHMNAHDVVTGTFSPKERQTPNHKSNCLDSSGKFKQGYPISEAAATRAKIIFDEKGTQLFVYHCNQCGEYHLTHKKY